MDSLYSIMLEHMDEDAYVLATTTAAARLLAPPPTRASLLAHPEVAAHFAELLHQHQSPDVRARRREFLACCLAHAEIEVLDA